MKKLSFLVLLSLFIFSCSEDNLSLENVEQKQLVSLEDIQEAVEKELSQGKVFYWEDGDDHFVWSAGMHSDSVFSIGYTIGPSFNPETDMPSVDINNDNWIKAKQRVVELILQKEAITRQNPSLTLEDILPFGEVEFFPQLVVQLTNPELISELRKSSYVRFVEPLGFSLEDQFAQKRSDSGCNGSPNYSINSSDYTTISPTTKRPWNFANHSIQTAWANSTGDNIRICIIDTGASDNQDNLGSQFTSGSSGGRTIQKYSTHVSGSWWWASLDSPNDPCGHGTSMAGFAAAPRGTDGNAVGVAYKADLMTIRAVKDVIISSSSERNGVRDALYLSGARSDVKIISMSIGTPFFSSTVADGVYYAYGQGKLMVAAAGTSLSWLSWYPVIFPANMAQTTAVTGLKDGSGNVKCTTCHSGPEVDFTIIMERASDDSRASISLASSTNQPKYTGGSSCATATVAGIAALVWAENPEASRTAVLQALKDASEFYPGRDDDFGWGKINAAIAVSSI
ncbi:MAG: S8 family serine peptidase [Saprospiraceae bacterium]|nr:S8 family serine peptidase [Saprospiraceae bacterium]